MRKETTQGPREQSELRERAPRQKTQNASLATALLQPWGPQALWAVTLAFAPVAFWRHRNILGHL